MRRREFIAALGGVAASGVSWPLAARAQQAMPVIGYLGLGSQISGAQMMTVFRQTLADAGYIDGRTVTIEPRWADGDYSRLPVEQPTRFDLVVNLKTAKALGIAVPPKLLFTADEVIE